MAVRSRGWRVAAAPIGALLVAGAVLVAHGQPDPVQRNSGVSVPVRSDSQAFAATPSLLVLGAGSLGVAGPDGLAPAPQDLLPGGLGPVSGLQQVSDGMSVALVGYADGPHAVLLDGAGPATDLGPADRIAAGAQPAVAAVQHGSLVTRFSAGGEQVGPSIALPPGMSLAADSARGVIASTVVGPLPTLAAGVADQRSRDLAAATYSAVQSGDMWTPIGAVQPLAAHGDTVLLWSPVLRVLQLLDLRLLSAIQPLAPEALPTPAPTPVESAGTPPADVEPDPAPGDPPPPDASPPDASAPAASAADPTASLPPAVARSLLPIAFPSLPGVDITGPATFSPDGARISVSGQVGSRPRLLVGQVPAELVRGQTTLAALQVISLGGELAPGQGQPTPVWSGELLVAARPDGLVALYSLTSGDAVARSLSDVDESDAPLSSDGPDDSDHAAADQPGASPSSGAGSPAIAGLGPA